VEKNTDQHIRSSAQGLFMMMSNGVGAFLGSKVSGWMIDRYFLLPDSSKDWHHIWLAFAAYSLVIAILFTLLFRHKHNPDELGEIAH
jgi:MFS family permease